MVANSGSDWMDNEPLCNLQWEKQRDGWLINFLANIGLQFSLTSDLMILESTDSDAFWQLINGNPLQLLRYVTRSLIRSGCLIPIVVWSTGPSLNEILNWFDLLRLCICQFGLGQRYLLFFACMCVCVWDIFLNNSVPVSRLYINKSFCFTCHDRWTLLNEIFVQQGAAVCYLTHSWSKSALEHLGK